MTQLVGDHETGRLRISDPWADRWEEGLSQLLEYIASHSDARIPRSYEHACYKLPVWVNQQRNTHAKGKLDPDRERRLNALPGWTWRMGRPRHPNRMTGRHG